MGLRFLFILLVVMLSSSSAQHVIGTYTIFLDPGRIFSWRYQWVSSPITLSKTNQGATNVDFTFFISPDTAIANGVLEVTFPQGFDLSVLASSGTATSVTGQVVQMPVSLAADVDTAVVIKYVALPKVSGPYGPFSLITRNSPQGQIQDANFNFGVVYITSLEDKISALDVTYTGKSSPIINRLNNILSFKFTISQNLWEYDYIKITPAWQFTLVNPSCRSANYNGNWNNFNGTRTSDPKYLDCIVTSVSGVQVLWIYGLKNDIDLVANPNDAYVNIQVSGFTNPDRDYPSSAYIWKIETLRFNTRNTLQSVVAYGPDTSPDSLFSASWVPTWGRPVTSILREQTIFMDLTFRTVNPIPAGGIIVVETSADSVAWGSSANYRCYVVTYVSPQVTCSQATGITTITGLGAIPAGTDITFRTLSKFTTLYNAFTEVIKTITTKSGEMYVIDVGGGLAKFTLPLDSHAYNVPMNVLLQDQTGATTLNKAGGTGDATQYLKFQVQQLTSTNLDLTLYRLTAANSNVIISCPLSPSPSDFQISIPTSNLATQFKTSGTTYDFSSGTVSFNTGSTFNANGSAVSITPGSITKTVNGKTIYTPGMISFRAGTAFQVNEFTVGVSVTALSGLPQVQNSGALTLPLVVSNPATVYECALDIIDVTNTLRPVRATAQFDIVYQTFKTMAFTYFCSNQFAGAPVKISFRPNVVDVFASTTIATYYVDIQLSASDYTTYLPGISTFHSSGAGEGEQYPMDSSLSVTPQMTVTTDGSTTSFVHRLTGLGDIAPQSPQVDIYFPVGNSNTLSPTISFKSYYVRSDDPRYRFYTHSGSLANGYTLSNKASSTVGAFTAPSITAGNGSVNGDSLSSLKFSLTLPVKITGDTYFYVVFPRGFTFSTSKKVVSSNPVNNSVFSFVKYFSATSLHFLIPGLLVKTVAAGTQIGMTATTLSISGINLALGSQSTSSSTSSKLTIVHGDPVSLLTNTCYAAYTPDFNTVAGKILNVHPAPTAFLGSGPEGVDTGFTLSFTLSHGVDLGGKITFTLNSAWATNPNTGCVVRGINPAVVGTVVTCSIVGNVFTISNFADFSTLKSISVTVILTHLRPPIASTDQTNELFDQGGTFASYASTIAGGAVIDMYTVATPSTSVVKIYASNAVLPANYLSIKINPSNAGTIDSDLYIKYTFPYNLPPYTVISITIPTAYKFYNACSSFYNSCYISPVSYSSCTCSSTAGTFYITLTAPLMKLIPLEVFFDDAVSAPSAVYSPRTSSFDGFRTTATWYGSTIIDDPTTYRAQQLVLPDVKVSGGISTVGSTPISFTPTNANELATYTFTFSVTIAVAVTDQFYIIWPNQYDPYVGTAVPWLDSEVGNMYMSCVSPQLGLTYCRTNHWIAVVQGSTALVANSVISIIIQEARNPPQGQTGYFQIYHVDINGALLEMNSAFGRVTITALPQQLFIKTLDVSSRDLWSVADYTFGFFMADTILSTTQLKVVFPAEYDLRLEDQKASYPCSTTWVDKSLESRLVGPQQWNSNRLCTVLNNTVTLPPPSSGINFALTSQITLKLQDIMTPQWGQVRTPFRADTDFDDVDRDVWTVWSWWTSQFSIYVYQGDTKRVSSRVYPLITPAYLGFTQPLRTISVNNYDPQDMSNRIIVYPGTQSQNIPISTVNSTMPLEAKSITFHPLVNQRTPDQSRLTFTSFTDNWIMLQEEWTIHFRVSANLNMAKGLYLVTWTLDEARQPGVEHALYSEPPFTLIEVPALTTGVFAFAIAPIPPVAVGTSSVPVLVSISNPPDSDVSVNIQLQGNPGTVQVSPSVLPFRPDIDSQSFNITVLWKHDFINNPTQTLLFTLTGTNSVVYSIPAQVTFSIAEKVYSTNGKIANMGVTNVTSTSFSMAPSTNQVGMIYYSVSPIGTKFTSYTEMRNTFFSFIETATDLETARLQNVDAHLIAEVETDPPAGVSWNQFQHQLFARHMTSYFVKGAIAMTAANYIGSIDITGLWGGSQYQIISYFDNLNPNNTVPVLHLEYVSTLGTANAQPVALTFGGLVAKDQVTQVQQVLAKHVGVNPSRLQNPTYRVATSRQLQSNVMLTETLPVGATALYTVFQFTVVANRALNYPTPTNQTSFSPEQLTDLTEDLLSTLGLNLTGYSKLNNLAQVSPAWVQPADVSLIQNNSLTVNYQSNTNGQCCCVALTDQRYSVSQDQVMEGYSANWTKVPGACGTTVVNTAGSLSLKNLQADEIYYIYCILADQYPLWPTLMQYTTTVEIPFIPVHTPLVVEVEIIQSGTGFLQVVLGLICLASIN